MKHVDRLVKSMEQVESLDSSDMCRNEFVIKRFELVRGNLQQRIKEVRDNVELHASLERKKLVLH